MKRPALFPVYSNKLAYNASRVLNAGILDRRSPDFSVEHTPESMDTAVALGGRLNNSFADCAWARGSVCFVNRPYV